jgi:RNA polymerase sigma factor (sigma-70 family)
VPLQLLRSLTVLDSSASATISSPSFAPEAARASSYLGRKGREPAPLRGAKRPFAAAPEPISANATDKELGQALIERHPDALPAAWRRYCPMVQRMLRRALGSSDLEDLVQDVFSCLFRRAHALRDADAIRPFVIGITRHTAFRERRRRMRRDRLAIECSPRTPDAFGVGSGPATSYASIKLARLLQRLTEQERTSFVLRFGHGMTVPEVAGALRVSEPTAKRRLSRARECLGAWVANDPFLVSYLQGKNTALIAGMDC